MELLFLRAYAGGYRGCAVDDQDYFFFQCRRGGKVRRLKSYPQKDFIDRRQFMLMMQKFISPPTFLDPPFPIAALTAQELERANARIAEQKRSKLKP